MAPRPLPRKPPHGLPSGSFSVSALLSVPFPTLPPATLCDGDQPSSNLEACLSSERKKKNQKTHSPVMAKQ